MNMEVFLAVSLGVGTSRPEELECIGFRHRICILTRSQMIPNHLQDWDSRPPCYDPCKLLQSPCHVPPHSPAKLHFSLFPHRATSPTIPTFALAVPSAQSSPFILLLPGENSYSSLEDQLTCHLLLEAFRSSFFAGPNPHVIPSAA